MPRFFIDKKEIVDGAVTLTGDDASHIAQSLRMVLGEHLTLCDKEGFDYEGELVLVSRERATVRILSMAPSESEPPFPIRLYQCLPKGDKLETVIQKAVECGVTEIIPVQSSRCIVKMKPEDVKKKLVRYNRIAEEAAKQSGRGIVPAVSAPLAYKEAILQMAKSERAFICYENEQGLTISAILRDKKPLSVDFLIGPEGGLSPEEVAFAKDHGVQSLSLGKRILRTETAAPFVLAILSAFFEL